MFMLRRITAKNNGLLTKGVSILFVGIIAGLGCAEASFAAAKKKDPATCSLSQSATGDLIATGGGLTSSSYQYELYSAPQASVGGGQLSTDASGNFSDDVGPLSFYMTVYPKETTLTFVLYPIIGNKADMGTVAASCSITP
jgi:hypothetical protein